MVNPSLPQASLQTWPAARSRRASVDNGLRLAQAGELVLRQVLVSEGDFKALDEGVLHVLAGLDGAQLDAAPSRRLVRRRTPTNSGFCPFGSFWAGFARRLLVELHGAVQRRRLQMTIRSTSSSET